MSRGTHGERVLRWRRPARYWMTFGATFAALRVLVRYASVMDACGPTVAPSRRRLVLSARPTPRNDTDPTPNTTTACTTPTG
ncbi:hypothetical protein [Streptomyces decoyicus]|uniref:hypothetical protein n=1 Tax=Streptomyces decoyicus TaxID=249567 RepID=UPI002E173FA1|nr:hypothetical protein OG532_18805 [Streptomyces decoyicus]